MNKKLIITVVLLAGIVLLGIKAKGFLESKKNQINNEPLAKKPFISVSTVYAKNETLSNQISYIANVQADKSIKLSTKLAGFIKKVYVSESDKVKKGDLLVTVDSKELNTNLEALKSTLTAQKNDLILAQKIYNRNKKLYKVGGISKEMLETSAVGLKMKKAVVEGTKQKIAGLENQLSYLNIVAPFDANIDTIFLHEGDMAIAGKPILSISNFKKRVIFSYALTKDNTIKKSQLVIYNEQIVGKIKTIYNTTKNGLLSAEVVLDKELNLPIGSNININIVTNSKSGCVVPNDTILHKENANYIIVYENDKFIQKKIKIELESDEKTLISPCTKKPIAKASESKLSKLLAYSKVNIIGVKK